MALPKLFQRIIWHNHTTPAVNEDNLNAMSKGLSDVDDRLIDLAGTIMEDVPQIQEDIEELEEDFALIDEKIADATSEANRATTKANEAAASVISAGDKALVAEGWAKGTQNGVPVGPTSPYHMNNAEYFKNQARSFTPEGYQDLVDDVAEAQEAITDIEGEKVSSNDAYVLRQCKGNSVDLELVGGSVAWNQLNGIGNTGNNNGVTWTSNGDGSYTVTGTASAYAAVVVGTNSPRTLNHVYLIVGGTSKVNVYTNQSGNTYSYAQLPSDNGQGVIFRVTNSVSNSPLASSVNSGVNTNGTKIYPQIFDLTALFGSSTIADYIYSLEQATAGAGVAWFRQYFPNLYYGYNAGSIQSVNPSYRKVVGKNLLKNTANSTTRSGIKYTVNPDGTVQAQGSSTAEDYLGMDIALSAGDYLFTGCPSASGVDIYLWDSTVGARPKQWDGTTASVSDYNGTLHQVKIIAGHKIKMNLRIASGKTVDILFKPMICLPSVTDPTYEPYQSSTCAFDTSVQLRGIPKLVDNKLSYDGDIYTADGSVTRKYGIVDLGTLDYAIVSQKPYFNIANSGRLNPLPKRAGSNATYVPHITNSSFYRSDVAPIDAYHNNINSICISDWTDLYIVDTEVADAAALKTKLSGVYLVYELATPTTESANAYQNPQRAFIDGTEEFVDAGVTASTRDVSIPVGNESEYNTSEVLPISQDYTDGAMEILKEIVASSSDFADFKTKVAAL